VKESLGGGWIMRVTDVMTSEVRTVREATLFKEAVELLLAEDISGLPVVDEYGGVVGIVTEADLITKEAYPSPRQRRLLRVLASSDGEDWAGKAEGVTVGDVMTKDPILAAPDDDVRSVARLMLERGIKRLPVVSATGKLVGIVSRHDLLRAYHVDDDQLERAVREILDRSLYVPPEHDITITVSDGVVTLSGTVSRASDIRIAPILVRAAEGVVGVTSELTYRAPDPKPARWGAGVG
jgi:CBS domain-containing protein